MVHDRGHDLYVPCMYFLADGRDEIIYRHILRWVKEQSNNCLDAETVVCNFEQGMMNAIRRASQHRHCRLSLPLEASNTP
ncbi:TPA: hypothetical protein N0F65_007512 [Lagenidium giganteum]|uniref:MULE transposase domain-containing protein n=1 Tax=Lagenidium giganteum TaxID=4803 RepID=A0AAV2ZIL8_9STRA|nr:TPA: hypothetical protein N0F65_007512 [Lagenidium giganteum]